MITTNQTTVKTGLKLTNGNEIYFIVSKELETILRDLYSAYVSLPEYDSNISYKRNMIKTTISEVSIESETDTSLIESLAVIMSTKIKNKNQKTALNMHKILDEGILEQYNYLSHDYIIYIWRKLTEGNKNTEALLASGYRKTPVKLYKVGKTAIQRELIYIAPDAKSIPNYMESLINFYNNEILSTDAFINAVLKSMVFSAYFVYVHPFLDGNGRTSRLIGNKCLVDHGLNKFRYMSFTAEIVKQKSEYGRHLKSIEESSSGDITDYIEFMTGVLSELLRRISMIKSGNIKQIIQLLSGRQKIMLNIIRGSAEGIHVKLYKNLWNTLAKEKGYKTIKIKEAEADLNTLLLEDLIVIDERYVRYPGFKYYKN